MVHIQIRNVPPELHRKLKARAVARGLTLSEYLLREAERSVEKPTIEELTERIRARRLPELKTDPADLIRADRDSH
jgi:antitoxin FitA